MMKKNWWIVIEQLILWVNAETIILPPAVAGKGKDKTARYHAII